MEKEEMEEQEDDSRWRRWRRKREKEEEEEGQRSRWRRWRSRRERKEGRKEGRRRSAATSCQMISSHVDVVVGGGEWSLRRKSKTSEEIKEGEEWGGKTRR